MNASPAMTRDRAHTANAQETHDEARTKAAMSNAESTRTGAGRRAPFARRAGFASVFGLCPLSFVLVTALLGAGSSGAQTSWPSERPPRPLAASEVKFPPYEFRTLKNGLQVIVVLHHEQPAVSLRLIVRAGGAQDPNDKPGVASLAATLLDQGTTTRSAQEIASAVDSVGGALGTGAGTDLSYINAVFMKDSFDTALQLVADLARNPAYRPEEIERQRQQMLSALQVSYDDPDYVASTVFDRLVYGFHPYGKPDSGTPASIGAITRADLVAFHQSYFAPNNAILAIVGDLSADDAFAAAERVFGDWPRNDALKVAPPADPPPPTRRVIVIDRPGAVQTEIRVGHIALPRKHPDYMAMDLASKILGGEGSNRLHRVLRSERGLTYGASAELETMKFSGDLVAETDTRSDATGQVLRLIVDEFWRLQRERVGDGELRGAQDYLSGSFPLTIETPSAIALQVLNAVFFGLDLNELETFRERVNAVTPDDIQRVAREYLRPDRLSIVLVGDASKFASQLPQAGFPQFERVPISELDLTSADFRRHASTGAAGEKSGRIVPASFSAAQPAPRETARTLVDRAIDARGGLVRLRNIRTVSAQASTTIFLPSGARAEHASRNAIAYPDRFRMDLQTAEGPVSTVYADGQAFTVLSRGKTLPLSPGELKAIVDRDVIQLLLGAHDGRLSARAMDEVMLADGTRGPALEFALPGQTVQLVFDASSGQLVAERYEVMDASRPVQMEERFADFRPVDGVMVAYKTSVFRNGRPYMERRIERIAFNVPLPETTFVRGQRPAVP
jgi:zinc protease